MRRERQQGYFVINLMNGESFEGDANNAKDAYSRITINKGDTTSLQYGYQTSVKEW